MQRGLRRVHTHQQAPPLVPGPTATSKTCIFLVNMTHFLPSTRGHTFKQARRLKQKYLVRLKESTWDCLARKVLFGAEGAGSTRPLSRVFVRTRRFVSDGTKSLAAARWRPSCCALCHGPCKYPPHMERRVINR